MINLQIRDEDVPSLRSVLSLALAQSEACLRDPAEAYWTEGDHNAIVALLVRIDAMLSDRTCC